MPPVYLDVEVLKLRGHPVMRENLIEVKSLLRVSVNQRRNQILTLFGYPGVKVVITREDILDLIRVSLRVKGRPLVQQLKKQHAQSPHVHFEVIRGLAEHFWGHVVESAAHRVSLHVVLHLLLVQEAFLVSEHSRVADVRVTRTAAEFGN